MYFLTQILKITAKKCTLGTEECDKTGHEPLPQNFCVGHAKNIPVKCCILLEFAHHYQNRYQM